MKKLRLLFFMAVGLLSLSAATCDKTDVVPGTRGGAEINNTGGSGGNGGGGGTVRKTGDMQVTVRRESVIGNYVDGATVGLALTQDSVDAKKFMVEGTTSSSGLTLFKDVEARLWYVYGEYEEGVDTFKDTKTATVKSNDKIAIQLEVKN